MTKIAWETLFAECRFYSVSQLHLPTIYDTPGCCVPFTTKTNEKDHQLRPVGRRPNLQRRHL
jgi:hypothetical protein